MKLELVIPTSLNEIPLMHYQQFIEVSNNSNDEELIAQKMIELFCGIKLKEVVKIKMTDVNGLVEHFTKLFESKPKFINRFKIKDVEFGFIPDLENISFGEYIDLDSNLGDIQKLHKAMAVMYRPITKRQKDKYDIEEYQGSVTYADVMKYAPVDVALGATVFFYRLRSELLKATLHYLEKEVETMTSTNTAKKRSSLSNGDGINQSMQLLREMQENLTKLPEWDYSNALPTLHLKNRKTKLKHDELKNQ
jgi:hypothetical protein